MDQVGRSALAQFSLDILNLPGLSVELHPPGELAAGSRATFTGNAFWDRGPLVGADVEATIGSRLGLGVTDDEGDFEVTVQLPEERGTHTLAIRVSYLGEVHEALRSTWPNCSPSLFRSSCSWSSPCSPSYYGDHGAPARNTGTRMRITTRTKRRITMMQELKLTSRGRRRGRRRGRTRVSKGRTTPVSRRIQPP